MSTILLEDRSFTVGEIIGHIEINRSQRSYERIMYASRRQKYYKIERVEILGFLEQHLFAGSRTL